MVNTVLLWEDVEVVEVVVGREVVVEVEVSDVVVVAEVVVSAVVLVVVLVSVVDVDVEVVSVVEVVVVVGDGELSVHASRPSTHAAARAQAQGGAVMS